MKTIQIIVLTPSPQDRAPRFIKKSVKNSGTIQIWKFSETGTYIMCPHMVSVNVKFEGSSRKIDVRNAKMPKSHYQPLCAYLMRYDAYLQSHPRSSPKRYINQKSWNPVKTIQVIVLTPSPQDRAPRFIKKSAKISGKIQILKFSETGTYILCPHMVSVNVKFEGSGWKLDFRNAKNA